MKAWPIAMCLLAVLGAACSASGAVVYSNLGTGDAFDNTLSRPVRGADGSPPLSAYEVAMRFTPSASYYLNAIDVAVKNLNGSTTIVVNLLDDDADSPGSILESASVTAPSVAGVATANFAGTTAMSGGTDYWVRLSPGAADGNNGWYYNSTGATGPWAQTNDGGSFWTVHASNTLSAFRVNGTAAPEPASLALLGLGGLIPAARALRRTPPASRR